jgi:DNA mismatch endonuclease (patch repair protein)
MDCHTKGQRRKNMQAIRSSNTKDEVLLAKALWKLGYHYRKNNKSVFGKPDLTFKRIKVAIFVDSEYFHGKNWEICKNKIGSNRKFWWNKIESNIKRDLTVNRKLRREGWKVLRFWSKEISKNLPRCTLKIEKLIYKRTYEEKIF